MNNVRKSLTALALLAGAWPLPAQTVTPTRQAATTSDPVPVVASLEEDKTLALSPFEVTASRDTGYQATETLAGTRIRTNLKDVGSAIQVITEQFMKDIAATGSDTLLQYTTNAEVAGTHGTYAGLGNGTTLDETSNLRSPAGAQRVRGLAAADNTRDFFVTDIAWDSFNVDRIDIQRGPNSFLFGLGSPAGIVNASIKNANFRNSGKVEMRTDAYGGVRASIDLNQQLIPNMLAIRVTSLLEDQKYAQEQAYQNQRRGALAIRFDPRLFKSRSAHTSIKVKAENGKIDANRPRTMAPYDNITSWWTGMDKLNVATTANASTNTVGLYSIGTNTSAVSPWLSGGPANQQQPIWFIDGTTNQLYQIYAGYVNTGAITSTGATGSASVSLQNQSYSSEFLGITGYRGYAQAANLPNKAYTRDKSLTDSSVFDFYHNLIDGDTKSEFEGWNAYNVDLSQTFLEDRLGINLTFDQQKYIGGGQQLLGNPSLSIDLQQNFQDGSTNPNYGRPYVTAGQGSGSSNRTDRQYARASLFGEVRPADFLRNDFLLKLFGRQRLNGVYSTEKFYNEKLNWYLNAHSQAWDGYWNQTTGATDGLANRGPVAVIYLGSSLASRSSSSGANIPGITAPVAYTSGNVYHFASTWKASNVTYSAPWTVDSKYQAMFGGATTLTQASNPANYVGWNSNFYDQLLSYNDGQDKTLINRAQKSLRETLSYAGSYQGYFWADALVATLGWRFDEVKTKDKTASAQTGNARGALDLSSQNYALPEEYPESQIKKGHSTSKSFVLHMNRLLPKDPLPINASLTFSDSSNFQVTSIRRDLYGNALPDPEGQSRDYGIWLATKNGKFSLRAVKYKTKNTANDTGLSGISGNILSIVRQGMKWRNVFLYQLGGYTMSTANQPSSRNNWNQVYPTLTAEQANAEQDKAITTWNNIQTYLAGKGFFKAWNFTGPTGPSASLVDRTTYLSDPAKYAPDSNSVGDYSAATAPQGFTVTADTESTGYEFEFTYNPLSNWRIAFNASETQAVRTNFGGPALDEFVSYIQSQLVNADGTPTAAGKMAQFGNATQFTMYLDQWSPFFAQYNLVKAQEGGKVPELRQWRYNIITNYDFRQGRLKGVGVGGGYRWQDKIAIGYPVLSSGLYDIDNPYYGPTEGYFDLWASYERKLTKQVNWRLQLNVRNVGSKEGLIPVTVEPDGTMAAARIKPVEEWMLTSTFSF